MITKQTLYGAKCDGCGETLSPIGYNLLYGEEDVQKDLIRKHWLTLGGKHYCPECKILGEGNFKQPIK